VSQVRPFGLAAEFEDSDQLLAAARAARDAGYRRFEGYSPYPIKELAEVIPGGAIIPNFILPTLVFVSGIAGAFVGFYMQYFLAAWVYPTNISGKPLNSWPAWVVITMAMAVLFALVAAFLGTLFFEDFPRIYNPLFRIPTFKRVSNDGFFLCIEAHDGHFHPNRTARFLESLEPLQVWEVDRE
jgi:hypothetical protein